MGRRGALPGTVDQWYRVGPRMDDREGRVAGPCPSGTTRPWAMAPGRRLAIGHSSLDLALEALSTGAAAIRRWPTGCYGRSGRSRGGTSCGTAWLLLVHIITKISADGSSLAFTDAFDECVLVSTHSCWCTRTPCERSAVYGMRLARTSTLILQLSVRPGSRTMLVKRADITASSPLTAMVPPPGVMTVADSPSANVHGGMLR
jgi:hypothetical protein